MSRSEAVATLVILNFQYKTADRKSKPLAQSEHDAFTPAPTKRLILYLRFVIVEIAITLRYEPIITSEKSKVLEHGNYMRRNFFTILRGTGETGTTVIKGFVQAQKPLVVIEKDEEILEELRELFPHLLIIEGDATKDEVLQEANIEKARGIITALHEDADNLFVVISARALNPRLTLVTRAVDAHTEGKMYRAGATHVISPNITEGARMAAMVLRPTVVSFLDVIMSDQEMSFRLEEITVPEGSTFHGKTLKEVEIPQRTGLIVIAMEKPSERGSTLQYNPQSTTVIHEKDKLIVLGDFERINELYKLLQV